MVEHVILSHMYLFSYPKDTREDYSSMPHGLYNSHRHLHFSLLMYSQNFQVKQKNKTNEEADGSLAFPETSS